MTDSWSANASSFAGKRTISDLMHDIVSDAISVAGLAIVVGGGYMLLAHLSEVAVVNQLIGINARGSAKIAAIEPAVQTGRSEPYGRRDQLDRVAIPDAPIPASTAASARNDGGVPEVTKGAPVPSAAALDAEVAKAHDAFDVPIHQAEAKTDDHPENSYGIEQLDQDKAQSVEVEFSFLEKDNGVPKSSLSNSAISNDKHDMKTSDMKIRGRQRTAAERHGRGRTTFEQVSLEIRNTSACPGSQSCSGDMPPLFGVGF